MRGWLRVNASFIEFDDTNERHWMLGLLRAYGEEKLLQLGVRKNVRRQFADCFCDFNGNDPALRLPLNNPYDKENLCQAGWYALDEGLTGATSKLGSSINRWLKHTDRWSELRNFNKRHIELLSKYTKTGLPRAWAHVSLAETLNQLGEPIEMVMGEYLQALKHVPKHWPQSKKEAHNRDRNETKIVRELSALYARKGNMTEAFGLVNEMLVDERQLAPQFRASLHDQIGQLYLDCHQWRSAIKQFEESLRLRENDTVVAERDARRQENGQARSWLNLGDAYQKSRENEKASNAYGKAASLWEKTGRQRDAYLALSKQAKAVSFAGNAQKAEVMFLDMIKQRRENHDELGAALTEGELAAHLKRMGKLERAEFHIESACAKLKDRGDLTALARSFDTAAEIFVVERKWPKAKQALNECLHLRENLGDRHQVITLDRLGQLYDALGDKENARKYFAEGIKRARIIAPPLDLARVLLAAAVMNARHGPFEEAETILAEAIPIFETLGRSDDATYACYFRPPDLGLLSSMKR